MEIVGNFLENALRVVAGKHVQQGCPRRPGFWSKAGTWRSAAGATGFAVLPLYRPLPDLDR